MQMIIDSNLHLWKETKRNYLISIIIFLGFLLRLYGVTDQSIWFDEALSIYYSQVPLSDVLGLRSNTPPLYYLLLHFWLQIMGNSEFSTRLLSLFFGTIGIFSIYILGSLIFNKITGIYSALLLAVSPIHIYYSQEIRTYALFFLLTLLSMYFYVKLKEGFSKGSVVGYIVFSVLLIYSHLYGVFILLAQNIDQFIIHNFKQLRKFKSWILLQLVIIILYIPWLIQLPEIIATKTYPWIPRPNLLILFPLSYTFTAGKVFSFYGLFLILVFFYVGFRYPFKSVKKESILLISWLLVPVVIPLMYSLMFTPVFIIKYAIIASFSLFLIVAYSLYNMKTFKKRGVAYSHRIVLMLFAVRTTKYNNKRFLERGFRFYSIKYSER